MEEAVIQYVSNGTEEEKLEILKYPDDPAWIYLKEDLIVFRGQKVDDKPPSVMPLFSTTIRKQIAREEFAGEEGCVWTITLSPGVKVLDVGKYLGKKYTKAYETEILVVGNGELDYKQTKESPCEYTARYSIARKKRPVTYAILRERWPTEDLGEPTNEDLETLIQPNEVLVKEGGKRKKTMRRVKHRRGKKSRGGLKRVSK